MFRSLAVIPLSVPRSKILKNILMKYQIYPETFIVIEGWGGGRMNFQSLFFSHWANVKKILFLIFSFLDNFFRIFKVFFLIWLHYCLQLVQFSAKLPKSIVPLCIKNSFKFKCSEFKEIIKNNTKCLIYAKSNKNTIINLNRKDTYLIFM